MGSNPSQLYSAPGNLAPRPPRLGPIASATPLGRPPAGLSPALSDFIEFQTTIAASRNLHLKDKNRVSVAKTSFLSGALAAGLTAVPTIISAINGQGERIFLIPILGTIAAVHGAILGLLLNHNRD